MNLDEFELKPLSEILSPREGYVACLNRWWVTAYGKVLFNGLRPLCDRSREALQKQFPGAELKLIEVAYLPNPYFGYFEFSYR